MIQSSLRIQSNRNHYGLPVFVYIPIPEGKKFHYDSVQIQLQITAVGYHKKLNKFYGLVLRPDGRKSHEEIDEQWIRDNNWQDWYETEDIIQYIKENTNQSMVSFYRCGWGFVNNINQHKAADSVSSTDVSVSLNGTRQYNLIEYQQKKEPTCAVSSFASMLHIKNHKKEAKFVSSIEIKKNMQVGESCQVLTSLSELFHSNSIFKQMRKDGYKIQHIKKIKLWTLMFLNGIFMMTNFF